MKGMRWSALIGLSVLMLAVVLMMSPAVAGDHCGAKAKTAAAGGCGNNCASQAKMAAANCGDCSDCPMPECCGICDGASCKAEMSHWKGLKYGEDGKLTCDLTAKQAKKVAAQYLKKSGTKARVVNVQENEKCFTVSVQPRGAEHEQTLMISKGTARVHKHEA